MDVTGAAAIVSGGASGLGEATVRRLHAAGAIVTVVDFNTEKGEALASELGVKFVKCDVTDAEQVAEAVAAATEDAPLRVGINCAGTGTAVRTIGKDGTPHLRSEWDRVLSINLLGTMLCMTHEASAIVSQRAGGRRDARRHRQHRVGGGVRRPDRPARLLGVEGRRGGHDPSGGAGSLRGRHPGLHHRPRPHGHARSSGCSRPRPRRRSATRSCTRSGSASRTSSPRMAMAIVDNDYLNGEVIRLDGAIRMQPK